MDSFEVVEEMSERFQQKLVLYSLDSGRDGKWGLVNSETNYVNHDGLLRTIYFFKLV